MGAIETLMSEHRVIEQAVDALVAFAGRAGDGPGDRAELARFVTFIREFADACHHGKEEDVLFRTMVEAGFPSEGGPIAVMRMEHDRGRAHVKALAELAARAGPWTPEDRKHLADEAWGYANLLRGHIHKEDSILYPMAERHLPPELMARVDAECEAFEERETGAGRHEELQALAADLVGRHAPSAASGPRPPPAHCCG
jgi:hemerythrin-like domain-containing protein